MNLWPPPQPIQHRSKRPEHQQASSRDQEGDAPEGLKPSLSNPPRLRSPLSLPSTTTSRLRHLFNPTLAPPPKSRSASSPSASRAGIATRHTSSLWRRSPVWFAAEAPPTPTICGSPSPAPWDARSATSSRYRSAGPITGTTIELATRPLGGPPCRLIPSKFRVGSGFRHGRSNKRDKNISKQSRGWKIPQASSCRACFHDSYFREETPECSINAIEIARRLWMPSHRAISNAGDQ